MSAESSSNSVDQGKLSTGSAAGDGAGADSPTSGKELGWSRFFGPGFLVAAAFIGPGTVTTAIISGGKFGFQLLWAIPFAVFATIIFQEMAARLGAVTGRGLAEAMVDVFQNDLVRKLTVAVVFAAIIFGNAAYQGGNLSGAAKGLSNFIPLPIWIWVLVCGLTAFVIIWTGTLRTLSLVLGSLVVLMSFTFVLAALASKPNYPELLSGLFSFEVPWYDVGVLIAIIGTTVVPYNLFLHASVVAEQRAAWIAENSDSRESNSVMADSTQDTSADERGIDSDEKGLSERGDGGKRSEVQPSVEQRIEHHLAYTKSDLQVAILIGGIVTASILITAAGASAVNLTEASELLTPLLGRFGRLLFFLGLFAAGLTSAITAPLAAGYVYAGCFSENPKAETREVKLVAGVVIAIGCLFGVLSAIWPDLKPTQIILIAQVANGMILPIVALFLIYVMNSKSILGRFRNTWSQNVAGAVVILFVLLLGLYRVQNAVFG